MAELSDRARQLLAKQRERYLASLLDKHREITALSKAGHSSELELIDAVHRIAGSAGLHGLTELQGRAVQAEQALRDGRSGDSAREALQALLDELARKAAQTD